MQSIRLILTVFVVFCSTNVSRANASSQSTSALSSIASDCLLTALDCVMQAPEVDPAMSRWGKAEAPASDCKFDCANETLSIKVPGTYHGLNPANKNLLAPRVLQDLSGNFSIEVKVRCFEPPASGSSTIPNSKDNFVGSGILVWQDEKNFFRLIQAANGDRRQKLIQLRVGDQQIFEFAYTMDAEYLYLKVSRIGKIFSLSISEDGKRWLALSVATMQKFNDATYNFGDSIRAGVVVINAINQEIQGEFKELKITNEPECAVHDSFRIEWGFPKTPLAELRDPHVQSDLQLEPDLLAALKALGTNPTQQGITNSQFSDLLAALKVLDAQKQALPVADRLKENSQPAQDLALVAWASVKPRLTEQQTKRLAGLAVQRFGPRSMLLDIVQEQLKLGELQLKSIANARKLLEESVAVRGNSKITPESESKYRELRHQANELLTEVATDVTQERIDELRGDWFYFSLPGMIVPEEFEGGYPLGPLADLLRQPAIQQELRLSGRVVEALDEFLEMKSREVIGIIGSLEIDAGATPSPTVAKAWENAYQSVDGLRRELEVECNKQLTALQNSRLQQLLFQSLGSQALLVSDSARDALELTAQQREDLRQIKERLAKTQNFSNLLYKSLRSVEDVSVLLSEKQREKLQSLKGATFRFVSVTR